MAATVTIDLDEFLSIKKLLADSEAKAVELTEQLVAARAADPSERVPKLTALARATLQVACFAVANLSPELIKRWPYPALRAIADGLRDTVLPDHSPHDDELAMELRKFASECEEWDQRRARFGEVEVPPPFPVEHTASLAAQ